MTPQELYDDHRARPRNIGKLLNANATGDVGSIVVGDALRWYLKIDDERITAARFQVFNAQDQVASASILTELAIGRTLDEAWTLGPLAVAAAIQLDPHRLPARLWGIEALRSAIATYRGEDREADTPGEPLVCRCHGVTEDTVRQAITVNGLTTIEDVVNATGAGTGCGSCRSDLPRLLEEATAPKTAPTTTHAPTPRLGKGRIARIHRISALVDEHIRPALRQVGSDLELMDLDGQQVVVAVSGDHDQPAIRDAIADLERRLKADIDPTLGVRWPA